MMGKGMSNKQKKADEIDLRAKKITRYRGNHNNKNVNPPGRLSDHTLGHLSFLKKWKMMEYFYISIVVIVT